MRQLTAPISAKASVPPAYQAIIRMAVDAVDTCAEARPDRVSFTVVLQTAAEQVIAAVETIVPVGNGLVGVIGQVVLDELYPPPGVGARLAARNPTSK
jgi:hypothetical protein